MDDRQRALAILAVASTIVGEGRSLGHAAHQSGTGRSPDKDQVKSSMDRFNTAMADIDRLILEADVLGPDGLSDIGRTLLQHGQDLTQIGLRPREWCNSVTRDALCCALCREGLGGVDHLRVGWSCW